MVTGESEGQVLPEGITEEQFAAARAEIERVVGAENVFSDTESVREFRDPYAHASWDAHWASIVVQPATVEEVQEIVRIANRHDLVLWTSSQGRNNAYGGAAPRVRGSVVVNLRRMNRILEVNEEMGYAVVEPGVSFFDLCAELTRLGGRWWASIPDLGWGSIVGNGLEHGVGFTPEGDHATNLCGMEIVLANGEVLHTGMGAMPDNPSWHIYRRGFGPTVDDIFKQSNFGIVTKVGKWLTPAPETYASLSIRVPRDQHLEPLIDTLRGLMLDGTIRNNPSIGSVLGAAAMRRPRNEWWPEGGTLTDDFIERVRTEMGLGYWNCRCALYGSEGVVDAHIERIRRDLEAAIPEVELIVTKMAGSDVSDENVTMHNDRIQAGVPGLQLLDTLNWWGGEGGHIDFAPVVPFQGSMVRRLMELVRPITEAAGLDYWPSGIGIGRAFIFVYPIGFDSTNEAQVRAAYDLYQTLVKAAAEAGFGVYRGHIDYMDDIADTYSFNGHIQRRVNETLKNALDPNGIFSPGKQGIWPGRDGLWGKRDA